MTAQERKRVKNNPDVNTEETKSASDYISESEYRLLNRTPEKIRESLFLVNPDSLEKQPELLFRYTKLMSFAHLVDGDCIKAEELCLLAFETVPADIDLYYVMASVNFHLKEYRLVVDYAQQYLELYKNDNQKEHVYTSGAGYLSDIYNYLGSAYLGLHEKETAEKNLKLSIDSDPSNYKGYINLARFYSLEQSYSDAFEILRQGINYCGDIVELQMLQDSLYHEKTADLIN